MLRAKARAVIHLAGRQRSGNLCAILQANGIPCEMQLSAWRRFLNRGRSRRAADPADPLAVLVSPRRETGHLIAGLALDFHGRR
ncbi:MAG: hypothetical protein HPM95_19650 [Alphaproteobacteria bacterium]|nr:hypothetical protein [Alphaproteobacteria bacterium]